MVLALALVAVSVVASPEDALAGPTACADPAVQRFGPASVSGAIVTAAVDKGHAYVVTRGQTPPVVGDVDLATRQVVRSTTLPDGPAEGRPEGAWASAVAGGNVYFGTYPVPDLYRFDPVTGKATFLRSFGANGGFIWSMAAASNGTLYLGTYPDGKVWEYVPSTGAVRDFGVLATGERYVRSLAVDDTTVYAGLLDKARLIAIDRSSGAKRQLATGPTGFTVLTTNGDRVLAGSGGTLIDVRKDGTDLKSIDLGGRSADAITVSPDGTAYLSTRPRGAILSYRSGDTAAVEIGTPRAEEETRTIVPIDGHLTGFTGSGGWWEMDPGTGQSTYTDLMAAGLTAGAERPQSMLLISGKAVYIGGHFSMTVRNLATGLHRRFWVPGEPKALVQRGDKVYAAIYPSGQIIEIDQATDAIRSLGYLGHGQQRPWDLEYDAVTDKLLVASSALGASLKGALSIVDPDTGEMNVYVDVIPDQSLMTLSLDSAKGIVYLGGDVRGGGGTTPTQTSASIAAFDLPTRKVLWRNSPIANYQTFQDLKVHPNVNLLYGVYKRTASWFAMDLATRKIVRKGSLAGYGELHLQRGKVFTATYYGGGNVHELSGTTAQLIATGLGDEWYTNPQLAFQPSTWNAWTLAGRDLALIRLDPTCPPVNVNG
ncbi:hypothetical protein GCM10009745_59180 [Kribbella yunnanensis]|uniref:WD40 repeat domain-containing protein n=1 Tax=Kribbella yunnanensis TaxID=190194 RepID=A0ABN2IFP2_9ACTN